jgi:hypothetical protein
MRRGASRAALEVAGVEFPGAHEVANIGRRDLRKPGGARAALVAAPMFPGGCRWSGQQQRASNVPGIPKIQASANLKTPEAFSCRGCDIGWLGLFDRWSLRLSS